MHLMHYASFASCIICIMHLMHHASYASCIVYIMQHIHYEFPLNLLILLSNFCSDRNSLKSIRGLWSYWREQTDLQPNMHNALYASCIVCIMHLMHHASYVSCIILIPVELLSRHTWPYHHNTILLQYVLQFYNTCN